MNFFKQDNWIMSRGASGFVYLFHYHEEERVDSNDEKHRYIGLDHTICKMCKINVPQDILDKRTIFLELFKK